MPHVQPAPGSWLVRLSWFCSPSPKQRSLRRSQSQLLHEASDECDHVALSDAAGKLAFQITKKDMEFSSLDVRSGKQRKSKHARYARDPQVPLPLQDPEYEALSKTKKYDIIWNQIVNSGTDGAGSADPAKNRKQWPQTIKMDLKMIFVMMCRQNPVAVSVHRGDLKPHYRKRDLHPAGCVATCRFQPETGHPFTGLFACEWDSGIIRASATGRTKQAAGIKVFRDGYPSANIGLLGRPDLPPVSQNREAQTFSAYPFSNVTASAPGDCSFWSTLGRAMERRFAKGPGTAWPTEVSNQDFACTDDKGRRATEPKAPFVIWLIVPEEVHRICHDALQAGGTRADDFRWQLSGVPKGSCIFEMHALVNGERMLIGKLFTTSAFISSSFADQQLFFWHETREHAEKSLEFAAGVE